VKRSPTQALAAVVFGVVVSLAVLFAGVGHAGDVNDSKSVIERVVVFGDRAEVTRTATARCTAGSAAVVFSGLPDAIDARTLRGEADGDAVFVGVSTQTTELLESLDEEVKKLVKDIEVLDDKLKLLARAQQDEDERSAAWQSYGPWARTLISEDLRQTKPDIGRWEQLLTQLSSESSSSSSARVARDAEVRSLQRQRERLDNRLQRLNPSAAPRNVTATVAVRCGSQASPVVRLSYVVPGARWNPEYDLRFTGPAKQKTGDGKAALTVAGVVTQSSGEDWVDVEVWLSTSKPRLGGEAPLPNVIYVRGQPEDKQKTLVQAQEQRADDLKAGAKGGSAAAGAELEDGGKAFVLKLPRRVTVRADGRPYWFPVDEVTTNAKSQLVAVPNLSPWVFQAVNLNNPTSYPLMEGVVHVFRGATFVGNANLAYRAPGEAIELSLGIDEEVALERKDLMNQKKEAGFFSGSQKIAQAYRTILHNRSDQDVTVEIREQVPVSKTADITVTIESDKTAAGYTFDKLRGHLKWQVSMKKGATEKRDVGFTIALPKEWAVQ